MVFICTSWLQRTLQTRSGSRAFLQLAQLKATGRGLVIYRCPVSRTAASLNSPGLEHKTPVHLHNGSWLQRILHAHTQPWFHPGCSASFPSRPQLIGVAKWPLQNPLHCRGVCQNSLESFVSCVPGSHSSSGS